MIALHKLAFVAAIALCSSALPAASMAATPVSDVSEISVPTADLDLGTAYGAAMLKQRIHAAAKSVCMDAFPNESVSSDSVRMCRIEAAQHVAPAVREVVREAQAKHSALLEASVTPR